MLCVILFATFRHGQCNGGGESKSFSPVGECGQQNINK